MTACSDTEGAEVPAVLARWYAAHASVRCLWAVEHQDALTVFITLEPTSDDDDAFPIWLANGHDWAGDLQARTNREVQLKLITSGLFEESSIDEGGTMIAQLNWRDSWLTSE